MLPGFTASNPFPQPTETSPLPAPGLTGGTSPAIALAGISQCPPGCWIESSHCIWFQETCRCMCIDGQHGGDFPCGNCVGAW